MEYNTQEYTRTHEQETNYLILNHHSITLDTGMRQWVHTKGWQNMKGEKDIRVYGIKWRKNKYFLILLYRNEKVKWEEILSLKILNIYYLTVTNTIIPTKWFSQIPTEITRSYFRALFRYLSEVLQSALTAKYLLVPLSILIKATKNG